MKCSNPACGKEEFKVTVQHRTSDAEHPDRLPVKLVCAKCGKPVKVWITNAQMKEMLKLFGEIQESLTAGMKAIIDALTKVEQKPWWKFW